MSAVKQRLPALLLPPLAGLLIGGAFLTPGTISGAALAWGGMLVLALVLRLAARTRCYTFISVGCGIYLSVFYWLPSVIARFGEVSLGISYLYHFLFVAVSVLQFVICYFVYHRLKQTRLERYSLALTASWGFAETIFPRFIPWTFGHSQLALPHIAAISELFGAAAVGYVVIWSCELVCCMFAEKMFSQSHERGSISLRAKLQFLVALHLLCAAYSGWRNWQLERQLAQAPLWSIGLIQSNLLPGIDFRSDKLAEVIKLQRELSLAVLSPKLPDVLIWPESSVWHEYHVAQRVLTSGSPEDPFPGLAVPLIFGGQARVRQAASRKPSYHNSAFLLDVDRQILGRYDKEVLFPFSEEVPLSQYFPSLRALNNKAYEVVRGNSAQQPLELPLSRERQRVLLGKTIKIATSICYEDMFVQPLRKQVLQGAHLLLALSNDSWFLRSEAVFQHFLLASWKAVEFRRFLVRVTVDGVSGVVTPWGKLVEGIPPFTRGAMSTTTTQLLEGQTLFAAWGELPLQLAALVIGIIVLLQRRLPTPGFTTQIRPLRGQKGNGFAFFSDYERERLPID